MVVVVQEWERRASPCRKDLDPLFFTAARNWFQVT